MEIWKEVPSFPLLEASSIGRVRSKPYEVAMPNGGIRIRQMAPTLGVMVTSSSGNYARFKITFRRKNYLVHRLVCEAFHGASPFENADVLHGNEDGADNRPENLSWGTRKENLNAPGFIAYCKSRTGDKSPRTKWFNERS